MEHGCGGSECGVEAIGVATACGGYVCLSATAALYFFAECAYYLARVEASSHSVLAQHYQQGGFAIVHAAQYYRHIGVLWTQGDEGTFKFQDDGGTNYFGFAKTDSYTIGANTDGITVQGGVVTLTYNITMSGRPCVWYKSSLSSGTWEQLNLPDGSAVSGASHAVTWEANPPANSQVCYINVGNQPQGFFRATVEVAGEAKFMTNMKADLSGGIICPNTSTGVNGVIKPSFNGSSVIWTWSAN